MEWSEELLKQALRPSTQERRELDELYERLCGLNPDAIGITQPELPPQ
jgi:hypothetical protein